MRAAIDFRGGCEEGTSNRSYWQGLVHGLTATCAAGDEIVLLTNGASELASSFEVPSKCRCVASPRMSERYWSLVWMPAVCRRLKADVAHVQYTVSPLFTTPVVTTIHDVSFFVHPAWLSRKDAFLLGKSVPLAVRKARHVLAVSEFTKAEIVRTTGCPASKISVTLNAPQAGIAPVSDPAPIASPYILSVGTLQSRKNWQLVVEAFARYRSKESLVIAGPCRIPRSELDAKLSELGLRDSVELTGTTSVEQLSALYSSAQALLHPSFYEGFGMTALEALKCGCPVVASNSSSLPEVVQGYGVLVDGFEPSAWAEGLEAATRLSSSLLAKGMEYADGFTWERTASQVWSVYELAARLRRSARKE